MVFLVREAVVDLTYRYRYIIAVFAFLVACGQAWDSGVLGAPPVVLWLVAAAVVLVPIPIVTRAGALWLVIAIFALLTAARVLFPVPLPTLHLAGLAPAFVLIARGLQRGRAGQRSRFAHEW